MIRRIILSLLYVSFFLIVNASSKIRETFYDNEIIKTKYSISDSGVNDGMYEEFFKTGSLKIKGMYREGIKTGTWIFFNELGDVLSIEKYDTTGANVSSYATTRLDSEAVQSKSKKHPKQGLAIYPKDAEVEVFVNGKSFGQTDKKLIELEVGVHSIEGRKKGYIPDIHIVPVFLETVTPLHLIPKKIKFRIDTPFFLSLFGKDRLQIGVTYISAAILMEKIIIGFKCGIGGSGFSPNDYDGIKDGTSYYYYDKNFSIVGLNFSHSVYHKNYFYIALGLECNYTSIQSYYSYSYRDSLGQWLYYSQDLKKSFWIAGPRFHVQSGFKYVKFLGSISAMIRCDSNIQLVSSRNFFIMETGLSFEL